MYKVCCMCITHKHCITVAHHRNPVPKWSLSVLQHYDGFQLPMRRKTCGSPNQKIKQYPSEGGGAGQQCMAVALALTVQVSIYRYLPWRHLPPATPGRHQQLQQQCWDQNQMRQHCCWPLQQHNHHAKCLMLGCTATHCLSWQCSGYHCYLRLAQVRTREIGCLVSSLV